MKTFSYKITDEVGIHARPAGMLVKEAKKYESKIIISIGDKKAEATRLMAIMGLGVKYGQIINIEINGSDEELAYKNMLDFFKNNF